MVSEFAPRAGRKRTAIKIGIAFGAVAAIGTAVAFNTIFSRPGEGALRLVPANALVVGTVDLSPSPNQALIFKKIDDALTRNGLDKKIDGAMTDLVAQGSAGEQIRPYAKRGAAMAMLPMDKASKEFDPGDSAVVFFPLSDGPAVAAIIKKHGKPAFWKGTRFHTLQTEGPGLMVVEDVLVVGMGPALNQVEQVAENKVDSILEREEFLAERSKIDPDSNLMLFVAPEAWTAFGKEAPTELKEMMGAPKWMAFGVAVRDGGLQLSFNGEYDSDKAKWLQPFSSMAPIRSDLLSVMPKGAYGFTALAQPSKYFESFELAAAQEKDGRKMVAELERDLAKEMNLSVRQDILPAFQGNAVIGFYPSPDSANPAGADLLVMIDDQNGAKAAALAERVREKLEQEMAEGGESPFEVKVEGDVKRYTLAAEASAEFENSIAEGMGDGAVKADVMTKNKTITWALIGQTVVASSSAKLLDQAIAGLKSRENGLDTDTRWQGREKDLIAGQQSLMAFNVARIVEGFENSMDMKKLGDDTKTAQEVMDALKGLNEPFFIKSATGNGRMSMGMFIPMEWEKLIDLIGKNVDK